jgi:hypothetical protein
MNFRALTPFALIAAVLLAAAVASVSTGAPQGDPTPRTASGFALRAL